MSDTIKTPKDKLILLWKQCCENTASKSFVVKSIHDKYIYKNTDNTGSKNYPFFKKNILPFQNKFDLIEPIYNYRCIEASGLKVNGTKDNIEISEWRTNFEVKRKKNTVKKKVFSIFSSDTTTDNFDEVML
jgi:hypothetical protein